MHIYIKYILFNFKLKCLILSCNHIDASAFTQINIFEHVAIRARDLTVPEDSQQRRIRNAWQQTSIKVRLNILIHYVLTLPHDFCYNWPITCYYNSHFRENSLCAGEPRDFKSRLKRTRLAERSVGHPYKANTVFACREVT